MNESNVPEMVLGLLQNLRDYQLGIEPDVGPPPERRLLLRSLSTALNDAADAARALVALEETRTQ